MCSRPPAVLLARLVGAAAVTLVLAGAALPHAAWRLTVNGLGPARIGMSQTQVANALGAPLRGAPIDSDDACVEKQADSFPGVRFMFERGRLTRISVGKPSRIVSPRGIGAGSTAGDIRRAYGKRLQVENTKYEPPPAEYLTYWTRPNKRGIRFETGGDRRVLIVHAGTESILYVEGCA